LLEFWMRRGSNPQPFDFESSSLQNLFFSCKVCFAPLPPSFDNCNLKIVNSKSEMIIFKSFLATFDACIIFVVTGTLTTTSFRPVSWQRHRRLNRFEQPLTIANKFLVCLNLIEYTIWLRTYVKMYHKLRKYALAWESLLKLKVMC
jgi:hypothetical protein